MGKKKPYIPIALLTLIVTLNSCFHPSLPPEEQLNHVNRKPAIFPDYTDITIPNNIAPLNFKVLEEGELFMVRIEGEQGNPMVIESRNSIVKIPPRKWEAFLDQNQGSACRVMLFKEEDNQWVRYDPFYIHISDVPIDPYVAYRLIPPGYETWSKMGLFQRDLTSFRERPIINNQHIEDNCVNCHSFCKGGSENMLFHVRGSVGGTMIKMADKIEKVDTKIEEALSAGVYPSWHPSGDYIAFSTNKIEQHFHANPGKTIEVHDRHSDLIIYHTRSRQITHVPGTRGDQFMETYPTWSPDGRHLYFSRTEAQADTPFDSIRYDIYRMGFDPGSGRFGDAEPVFLASQRLQSASFPRISPDGKHLLCTIHNYGTFPIWHREADLCLVDLATGEPIVPEMINSEDSDSYHSWSANGEWIIFSSRRYDGQYTKLYISHLDQEDQFRKPFLIPQHDPEYYHSDFYSYNRPELINGPVSVNPRKWIRASTKN